MSNLLFFSAEKLVTLSGTWGDSRSNTTSISVRAEDFISMWPTSSTSTHVEFVTGSSGIDSVVINIKHPANKNKELMQKFISVLNSKSPFTVVHDSFTLGGNASGETNPHFNGLIESIDSINSIPGGAYRVREKQTDADGQGGFAQYGSGFISTAVDGTHNGAPQYFASRQGNTLKLECSFRLAGMKSSNDVDDIIGVDGDSEDHAFFFFNQQYGDITGIDMRCDAVPTASSNACTDINLTCAASGSNEYNDDGSAFTQLIDSGVWSLGEVRSCNLAQLQSVDQLRFFYITTGATHTAESTFTGGAYTVTISYNSGGVQSKFNRPLYA